MTYLNTLKKLAQACMRYDALIEEENAYFDAIQPERILQLIAVVDAAKALRLHGNFEGCWGSVAAFDAALAALEGK